MTWSQPEPAASQPPPGRRGARRWWLLGGLIAVLVLTGVAVVYAGSRMAAEDRGSGAEQRAEPSVSPPPSIPPGLLPTAYPEDRGMALCVEVEQILSDEFVELDVDYVESRRRAADRLRELDAPTPVHQAALDEFADALDATARMVEDDPAAEPEALERDRAANDAFIDAGGCDPA